MADLVYLVRHAAPPPEKRGRYWGRGDPGVDSGALSRIAALADLTWEKPARLFSSPLDRTMLTASALAERFAVRTEAVPELAEIDFGDFDGLDFGQIAQCHPLEARRWEEQGDAFVFPGGESVDEFLARAEKGWRHCIEAPASSVMAVTHGGVILAWLCLFLRLPFSARFAFRPAYGALTAFIRKKDGSGWAMTCFNNLP